MCLVTQSDFLQPQWTAACQAPLSMGTIQARILEWVAMLSSRGSSQPRIEPGSPTLQADSLLTGPPGKPFQVQKEKTYSLTMLCCSFSHSSQSTGASQMKPIALCLKPTVFISLQKVMNMDNRWELFAGRNGKEKSIHSDRWCALLPMVLKAFNVHLCGQQLTYQWNCIQKCLVGLLQPLAGWTHRLASSLRQWSARWSERQRAFFSEEQEAEKNWILDPVLFMKTHRVVGTGLSWIEKGKYFWFSVGNLWASFKKMSTFPDVF